ncbi:hypothetical protein F5Y15DRAFT_423721 [Xylariaceae sp. FL0016]|nr:hypothetical protein F5Y15DRAFT_423721 [Xylariaceae sp. FL0016]
MVDAVNPFTMMEMDNCEYPLTGLIDPSILFQEDDSFAISAPEPLDFAQTPAPIAGQYGQAGQASPYPEAPLLGAPQFDTPFVPEPTLCWGYPGMAIAPVALNPSWYLQQNGFPPSLVDQMAWPSQTNFAPQPMVQNMTLDPSRLGSFDITGQALKARPDRELRIRKSKRAIKPKTKRFKSESNSVLAAMARPLTQLLSVGDTDIEQHACRGTEQRLAEQNGSAAIKRPMNAFMLYRRAYSSHVHNLLGDANFHNQINVSAALGFCWRAEDDSAQAYFRRLAQTEKDNHRLAFPGYKFAPGKPNRSARKARSEAEEQDVSDEEWAPGVWC